MASVALSKALNDAVVVLPHIRSYSWGAIAAAIAVGYLSAQSILLLRKD